MTQAHPAENKLRGVQREVGAMSDNKNSSKSDSSRGSSKEQEEDVEDREDNESHELTTQEQAAAKRIADWGGLGKRSGFNELNLLFLILEG